MRTIGTLARGIRTPIIQDGDDLIHIVISSLKRSMEKNNYSINDNDIVGITESVVARAQGNYVTLDDIREDIEEKFKGDIGVLFPILSRNRFAMILKGIAQTKRHIYLQLSYPADEVGNHLMNVETMDDFNVCPHTDILSEEDYRRMFGEKVQHPFTGVDYVQLYKELAVNDNITIFFANDPTAILKYTEEILTADIHTRQRTKRILQKAGAKVVLGLDDLCTQPKQGGGYNPEFGLLGSNKATEEKVKLFPREGHQFVTEVQSRLKDLTGKHVEVMIYGDGAFKDPVGKIWELADPVISPGYTAGLCGRPNEIKLKYLADNVLHDLQGEELLTAMKHHILHKHVDLTTDMMAQGTTPRQLTDLIGSLCDLVSGSGDKGTPIVLVQGYFDNLAVE